MSITQSINHSYDHVQECFSIFETLTQNQKWLRCRYSRHGFSKRVSLVTNCSHVMKLIVIKQEAQLTFKNRASAWCIRVIITLLSGTWLFDFSYTLRVRYLANLHGNGCMRVYKNSTHSSKEPQQIYAEQVYRHKLASMRILAIASA